MKMTNMTTDVEKSLNTNLVKDVDIILAPLPSPILYPPFPLPPPQNINKYCKLNIKGHIDYIVLFNADTNLVTIPSTKR